MILTQCNELLPLLKPWQKGGKASSEARLNCARRVHHEVCSLLLSALESLRATLAEFGDLVPAVSFERAKVKSDDDN